MPLLDIEDVHKSFGGRKVLDGVSFSLERGEACAIIGPSGEGKTSLLKCISLLYRIEHGRILLSGQVVAQANRSTSTFSVEVNPSDHRRRVGMVFQEWNLWPNMTVRDNIALAPISVLGVKREKAYALASALSRRVAIEDKLDSFPHSLSGGQKQRAAIARALAMSPEVLMLDEITSALDPVLSAEVLDVMASLKQDGLTLLLVTHHIAFAKAVADKVVFLERGCVREHGASSILDHPTTDELSWFLGRVKRIQ